MIGTGAGRRGGGRGVGGVAGGSVCRPPGDGGRPEARSAPASPSPSAGAESL